MYIAWPAVQRSSLEKAVRRVHAKDVDPSALGSQQYRFSDAGIEAQFATGHALYEWGNICDVEETDTHVFIYLSPVKAVIIPKNDTLHGATGTEIVTKVRESIAANAEQPPQAKRRAGPES
jgi:YcxB-like protein